MVNLTITELELEIDEKSKDLRVFLKARDDIQNRVNELQDSPCRLTPLPDWSGTFAVLGSLDLVINAIDRTISELKELKTMTSGEKDEQVN